MLQWDRIDLEQKAINKAAEELENRPRKINREYCRDCVHYNVCSPDIKERFAEIYEDIEKRCFPENVEVTVACIHKSINTFTSCSLVETSNFHTNCDSAITPYGQNH